VRIAVAVLVIFSLVALVHDILWPYKRKSNVSARQTVQTVVAKFAPSDQVLIANHKAPYQFLPRWEGTDCAVIQFYLHTLSSAPIRWAVPAEQVQPVAGTTWVVYYEAPEPRGGAEQKALFAQQVRDYLKQLSDRLGEPATAEYEMVRAYPDRLPGVLWVYCFPPSS
jgi:hypothetical protein